MKSIDRLLAAYLDDREALSAADMARLAAELDRSPALAQTLKDQLVVRELLSQRLAEDRRQFPAQVAQRRRDFERGEDALFRQVMEVRSLAVEDLERHTRRRPPLRRYGFWLGLAAALVTAVAAGVYWERLVPPPSVAHMAAVEGSVTLERQGQPAAIAAGVALRAGDQLRLGEDARATVRYADGTTLWLDGGAVVRWEGGPSGAKRVSFLEGGLSATVAPQATESPLTVETSTAEIRVLGTEFFAYADAGATRVGVSQGRVALVRRRDGQSAEVAAGSSGFASADELRVWPGLWPTNPAGAALVVECAPPWQEGEPWGRPPPIRLVPQGRARLNEHGALVLDEGAFVAAGAGQAIYDGCRQTGQLTVEAIVRPNAGAQTGVAIVFSAGQGAPNFALTQAQGRFGFLLKTSDAGGGRVFDLADVTEDEPQRITVTYRPGRLTCYLDGRVLFRRDDLRGDFRLWAPGELIFGEQPGGGHNWRGVLEGIAIYNRALGQNEVQRNAAAFETLLHRRRPISASDLPPP